MNNYIIIPLCLIFILIGIGLYYLIKIIKKKIYYKKIKKHYYINKIEFLDKGYDTLLDSVLRIWRYLDEIEQDRQDEEEGTKE